MTPASTATLVSELVAIDSVNPSLVPGGAGESEIAAFVAGWAAGHGLEVQVLEGSAGRPSVVVRARGSGGGRSLLLCGHSDTVTVAGMRDPHSPRVDGDRLYGRGAYDMKAGVAAALVACSEVAGLGLRGDVACAVVADEEHASLGVQEVLANLTADAAIVTEPTELELIVAHKGFVWSEIEISGRAAHGSRHDLGVDAIVKAGPVLTALGELDAELGERAHQLLGRPSLHAGLIEGGEALSSYPARCLVSVERRTLPGENASDVEEELRALLASCRAADPELRAEARQGIVREPFEVAEDAEIVRDLGAAGAEAIGGAPAIGGAGYWTDAAFIAAAGIPAVLFGPGGEGAHTAEEWVSLPDTEAVARTLVGVARRYCA